jgi:hypothetical protein
MSLARLFAWLDRVLARPALHATGAVSASGGAPLAPPPSGGARVLPGAALLSVDGGGQWLLCGADRCTLGHVRAAEADLLFLADVGARHATLVRADTLHDGPGWRIEPVGDERVRVGDELVGPTGRRLAPDDRVRLGENLEFRLRWPDPASASAVLVLQHGVVCAGARHVVLLAPGPGGRVRIGPARAHAVVVPGLALDLVLEWHGDELEVQSSEPLEGALRGTRGRLPFPPPARLALGAGRPQGSRPPFGFSLEPVVRP